MKHIRTFKIIVFVLLTALLILPLIKNTTSKAKINDSLEVKAVKEVEKSLFDGVLELVAEKGSGIVKDNLPMVGDYLCAQLFDYIGIDYTDSYTKELKNVNKKLDEIETGLKEILANQQKQIAQNTMIDFYNNVDVFSKTVYPLYAGFNTMMLNEVDEKYSPEQARIEQEKFYNNNLKNILFGSSTSTGDLYLQLINLLDKITVPNKAEENKTLMEYYHTTYAYLWAFEMQSFNPKREFLGYVSTTVLEGLTLYAFQNAYEIRNAEELENEPQKIIYQERWNAIKSAAEKAIDYLQNEIKELDKKEAQSNEKNSTFHYASGKTVSRKLFTGKAPGGKDRYYGYCTSANTTRQGNVRHVKYYTLDCRDFVNKITNDYNNYKKNYKKASSYTITDFLKEIGFTCDNWNCAGLYRGQSHKYEGTKFTTEFWRFYVEFTKFDGAATSEQWGRLRYAVLGSPGSWYSEYADKEFMGFVSEDGFLIGSYETIYSESGNTVVDNIRVMVCGYSSSYTWDPSDKGKVW